MTPTLKARLESVLGSAVVAARALPVGFGLTGLDITLADGRRLAVKAVEQASGREATLDIEGFMLGELRAPVRPAGAAGPSRGARPAGDGFHRQ